MINDLRSISVNVVVSITVLEMRPVLYYSCNGKKSGNKFIRSLKIKSPASSGILSESSIISRSSNNRKQINRNIW
ncbi:MAG: hypothetical protein ABI261_02415 [Ginsengibacter sp.]